MICLLIEFVVKPGQEDEFVRAWSALTRYARENFGSRGSRLHRASDSRYIGYAQWPDERTHATAGDDSESYRRLHERMNATLERGESRLLETMEVEADLLDATAS
jgi:heme-degrading monooxygenase HmoA